MLPAKLDEGMRFNFYMLSNLKPNVKEDYMIFLTTLPPYEKDCCFVSKSIED
jgi:hypothetical protein